MTKEKAVNKAIELEFGIGNVKSIREHNSSLVKVTEHLYDLLQPSTPPDFDTEVYNWLREHGNDETRQLIEMTARHFWGMGRRDERCKMMRQGFTFEYTLIGRNTIENLDMDALKKAGIAFGDKVKVIIVKEGDKQ